MLGTCIGLPLLPYGRHSLQATPVHPALSAACSLLLAPCYILGSCFALWCSHSRVPDSMQFSLLLVQARAREEQTQAAQEAAICRREEEAAQRR